jgi:hypothetical protein
MQFQAGKAKLRMLRIRRRKRSHQCPGGERRSGAAQHSRVVVTRLKKGKEEEAACDEDTMSTGRAMSFSQVNADT